MSHTPNRASAFIQQAESLILENLSNEQFGVSELAEAMSMSRSNLLRKIKKQTQLSASQFIRKVRLIRSMELLNQTSLTISEISHRVGFGSTSYFIKCFREQYGHPPGELARRHEAEKADDASDQVSEPIETVDIHGPQGSESRSVISWSIVGVVALLMGIVAYALGVFDRRPTPDPEEAILAKSIAVLPFKNESSDSSNLYFVNGLMESTLNNLQKIEDLLVISRSSVERYRTTDKSIPQMAEELNVNYFVTGSGQKIGDQVLLNIQLIEASSDRQIWAEQYNRKVVNIFELQNEVARNIAASIQAIVTPAELELIEKPPTDNLLAYDYYLQALDPFLSRTNEGLTQAIGLFEQAIKEDPEFSLAYANIGISYYLLDMTQAEKQHTEKINSYADKALLYDSKSDASLIAKAFYYIHAKEYQLALPHLQKALEYNPNSSLAVQMLADFYFRLVPDSKKYLEYALKGVQLNLASDSVTQSYIYLQLGNALIQNGFVEKALNYINQSLRYDPENYYAPHVKLLVQYAQDRNIEQTTERLEAIWQQDTSRLDILQEVANFHYYQENYERAFFYFEKFVTVKERYGLDIYPHEDLKIGVVYEKMGLHEQAANFFRQYTDYCQADQSIYKHASMASIYALEGDVDKAIELLKQFSTQKNYQYWILVFMEVDPIMAPLRSHPEFEKVFQQLKDQFWKHQATLRKSLEAKGLI